MRILYNSKDLQFKDPFGTLTPGETCTLHIHIPANLQVSCVTCEIESVDGVKLSIPLSTELE